MSGAAVQDAWMGKQALFRCVFVIADALKKPLNPTLQPTSQPAAMRDTAIFRAIRHAGN